MKKLNKIVTLMLSIFFFLSLTACGNKKPKKENEVIDIVKSIEKYNSDVEINIVNSREKIQLKGKQTYVKGEVAKLEIDGGRQLVYKGEKIQIDDLESDNKYSVHESFDSIYKLSFMDEYIKLIYNNEKIKYKYKQIDGQEYLIVVLDLPYNNRNLNEIHLYLNYEEKKPYKVVIYSEKHEEKVNIVYKNFKSF
ncbi:germination lipoprotein GerS-related protein [Haloimpatiens lingqiaonensis]|uniref:germination lipoprotein GerS-related protein n=1 Tax=Haloimpatiens lingqiaonensis TaxID=1380675 RepID=UPI0010FED072|nr:germination lipoprotein GerS-related protein [Haloimpatiens lingqiaonensis]